MRQRRLAELLPGGAGGATLANERGPVYMARLGGAGGRATLARHGHAYMGALARRAALARWERHYSQPRTGRRSFGGELVEVSRLVPYRPASSQRRRPDIIRIAIEVQE